MEGGAGSGKSNGEVRGWRRWGWVNLTSHTITKEQKNSRKKKRRKKQKEGKGEEFIKMYGGGKS